MKRCHLPADCNLTHIGSQLTDFADTAAVVMNLDLVHFAFDTANSTSGRCAWETLLGFAARLQDRLALDGLDRTDSPWYPDTMRLFRQQAAGDWSAVVAEVVAALDQWMRPPTSSDFQNNRPPIDDRRVWIFKIEPVNEFLTFFELL